MNLITHTLPSVPSPKRFIARLQTADAVTGSVIGIVTRPIWAGEGPKGSIYKRKLEAITLFLKPKLFVLDFRKQP